MPSVTSHKVATQSISDLEQSMIDLDARVDRLVRLYRSDYTVAVGSGLDKLRQDIKEILDRVRAISR